MGGHEIHPAATEEREQDSVPVPSQKEPDPETIFDFQQRSQKEHDLKKSMVNASPVSPVPVPNRVRLLYKGHQILNLIFAILIGSIAVLRWYTARAESDKTAILICLVDSSMLVLVCVLPQSMISIYRFFRKGSCLDLEAYIWTSAMVLDHYVALLMINTEYIRIGLIPVMILVFIVTLGWQSTERGTVKVSCSEKDHDGVNNDKLELFDLVSYHLLLSFLTWTQYKGRQGCTPVLSDFLLFLGSTLAGLETMLASPLACLNSGAMSGEVLPVLHKTRIVVLFIAVHTLAAEWLGDDMIYVCLPELITVFLWFTIFVGESTSIDSFTSVKSQVIIVSSVMAILACLIKWNANDSNMLVTWIIWAFWISISSSAFSQFHVWLLQGWPASSAESNNLICLLNVSRNVSISITSVTSGVMMVTAPRIMYDAIYNFEHKAMAAIVAIIFLLSFLVWSVHGPLVHPETQIQDRPENKTHPNKLLEAQHDTSGVAEDVVVLPPKLKGKHSVINKTSTEKVHTPPNPISKTHGKLHKQLEGQQAPPPKYKMNSKWTYLERFTLKYLILLDRFLEVAEANNKNDFMHCPCTVCGNTKKFFDYKTLHSHLLWNGFMPHYNFGTKQDDDNYPPPEYGDDAMREAEDQEEPYDVLDDYGAIRKEHKRRKSEEMECPL